MGKKMTKKQLKEVQKLATQIVITSGVAKRIPAHNVYKKKRSQAVKEAYAILHKPKPAKSKSKAKQLKLKF